MGRMGSVLKSRMTSGSPYSPWNVIFPASTRYMPPLGGGSLTGREARQSEEQCRGEAPAARRRIGEGVV